MPPKPPSAESRICAAAVQMAMRAGLDKEVRAFLRLYEFDKTATAVRKQEALALLLEATEARFKSLVPRPVDGDG